MTKNDIQNALSNPFEAWQKLVQDNLSRLDGVYDEMTRRNAQAVEQANAAIGELAKLAKDSLSLQSQISEEWLRIAQKATKETTEFLKTAVAR